MRNTKVFKTPTLKALNPIINTRKNTLSMSTTRRLTIKIITVTVYYP